jgi:hypothetical protein
MQRLADRCPIHAVLLAPMKSIQSLDSSAAAPRLLQGCALRTLDVRLSSLQGCSMAWMVEWLLIMHLQQAGVGRLILPSHVMCV